MATPSIQLNDGTSIPWLAFGSGTALYSKDATKQITDAIKAGFRHIDAAQAYSNEETVGDGIVQSGVPRSELYITTKLGKVPDGKTVKDTLQESLKKLQTDYVDLFLIHTPVQHADLKSTWKELEELKAEGLTRSIGVSNFLPKHFDIILEGATVVPAVNQIEYHPYVFKASQPQIDLHKQHKIVATSYGGLTPITRFPGGPIDPALDKAAKRLAEGSGKSVTQGQVLQLWLRKKDIPCITVTSKAERLKEYLSVAELPELTEEEERAIDESGSTAHHRVFSSWIDKESNL
ncbi:hypothetical protein EW026_g3598 [Hermanssonia centrifuga]|uniref:NADP-dependent oxidoreductase domain-containing protein n=1 Tax=Hermanssonia centrifuga TaxID=98765 RepID=A0A4S4KJQ3_9APHY|nr:hypothetical protein EW026_g3598 [Hermanssonia centrifuga]